VSVVFVDSKQVPRLKQVTDYGTLVTQAVMNVMGKNPAYTHVLTTVHALASHLRLEQVLVLSGREKLLSLQTAPTAVRSPMQDTKTFPGAAASPPQIAAAGATACRVRSILSSDDRESSLNSPLLA
jgi:hypothetical protein